MAKRDVKIELPVNDAPGTFKLADKVIARNTALGLGSPIQNDFPWAVIFAGAAGAKLLMADADAADRLAQSLHYRALDLLGTAPGQNLERPDTLHQLITKVRDVLLVKNQNNPEALSVWGFNVVVDSTEGKRTVRVEIPVDSPENFIELCQAVVAQQTLLGVTSPLNGKVNMALFETKTAAAAADFAAAETQREIKEAKHGELMVQLGYAAGQTSETPKTSYNFLTNVRDLLLVAYQANPQELERWGFDVVVTESVPGPGDVPPPPVP